MARKEIRVTITAEGRDQGKVFVLREMPATQAEKWAFRAFLALAKAGVDIPPNIQDAGLAGIAVLGFKALGGVSYDEAERLMDEMFKCISFQPDPRKPDITRPLMEEDIEEIATRAKLRMDVFELHTGFSLAGAASASQSTETPPALKTIQTSPVPSAPLSRPARHR